MHNLLTLNINSFNIIKIARGNKQRWEYAIYYWITEQGSAKRRSVGVTWWIRWRRGIGDGLLIIMQSIIRYSLSILMVEISKNLPFNKRYAELTFQIIVFHDCILNY